MKKILLIYILFFGIVFNSCTQKNMKKTNHLSNETSPYLLQHVYNPVDWYPWGKEALEKAKKEDKLLLISIGYSACHWCHVMEKESFEDLEVAKVMNETFVCIKIDKEERPDIDQIYMNAVHLMRQRGGWPLNCIALPDGRPIWGGTYFKKDNWITEIQKVNNLYRENPQVVLDYATTLTEGIVNTELVNRSDNKEEFSNKVLNNYYGKWSGQFDHINGGRIGSPKFPLPNNYQFLLDYGVLTKKSEIIDYVELTLTKIMDGGIYDQIGGGFCRYSVDKYWKVPHFEKMLYDNAQLISLYSSAYTLMKKERFKSIIYQTLDFIERELYDRSSNAFYSSLDADSEGEEGKFYVWEKEELRHLLKEDYTLCEDYYNVNDYGRWEDKYILLKKSHDSIVAEKYKVTYSQLQSRVQKINTTLFNERKKRIRPGLDDKCLTSWNGLMLKGYTDAYKALNDKHFLNIAIQNANFILKNQIRKDNGLFHSYKNGVSSINGFLEDYAFVIEGFIGLYEVTFKEKWLNEATKLTEYTLKHFFDEKSGMFFFTSDKDDPLITRKMEITDNVIPSSNSSLANSLFLLGSITANREYINLSKQMLKNIESDMHTYGPSYSNWGSLMLKNTYPFYELAIVGKKAHEVQSELSQVYLPNKVIIGSKNKSNLEILENKFLKGETMIYVCQSGACQQPTIDIKQALSEIKY